MTKPVIHVCNDSADGRAVEIAQNKMRRFHETGYAVAPIPADGSDHPFDVRCLVCSPVPQTQPMKPEELGRYVCVAHGGCLHSPHITITSEGVWVKTGQQWSSAHRDCFQTSQPMLDSELFKRTAPQWNCVDYPGEGMHYVPEGDCVWCGMTQAQIRAERQTRGEN